MFLKPFRVAVTTQGGGQASTLHFLHTELTRNYPELTFVSVNHTRVWYKSRSILQYFQKIRNKVRYYLTNWVKRVLLFILLL